MDWFERLTGFAEVEVDAQATRRQLRVEGERLFSRVNGRSYGVGRLEVVKLAELRSRVAQLPQRPARALQARAVRGDVRQMHQLAQHAGALFQVASQFNLLEMVGPDVTPEDGVARYAFDRTQGPACAIAAGAATIFRNYFAQVGTQTGQTKAKQINTLAALGAALGHDATPLWTYRNGYALCSRDGLARVAQRLGAADEAARDRLRSLLEIGIHWDVEVTDAPESPGPMVSQAFCSALPVAYGESPPALWEPFARLVLEAAYEATLMAGALNAARPGGSRQVLLTRLGGGAFGNAREWIDDAIERALRLADGFDLDVLHVTR